MLAATLVLTNSVHGETGSVSELKVEHTENASSYVISKMGSIEVQEFMMKNPPRLVIDFVGAEHGLDKNRFEGDSEFVRQVRTSQFTNDPHQVTRVVFDLKGNPKYKVSDSGETVTVKFWGDPQPERTEAPKTMSGSVMGGGFGDDVAGTVTPQPKPADPVEPEAVADEATEEKAQDVASAPAKMTDWNAPRNVRARAPQSSMVSGMPEYEARANQGDMGMNKNITIDVQNADIKTVLHSMSEFSGTNIISGPEVEGKVTAHLRNVPWRQALDIILKAHAFGWREEYGIIRVSTAEGLVQEELDLQMAERKRDELLPLVTEIMPLSYANADEMGKALKEVLTQRGSIEIEKGNNALVVTDIEKNVEKIAGMVVSLDRKIKQVEIVAKMVDVDYEATQEMGVRWEALQLGKGDPHGHPDIGGIGDGIIDARGNNAVGTFRVGTIQDWGQVLALIDLLAKDNKANIISNPRIVTADNREASILVGKEIPLIVSDEAGNPITELTKVGITLRVTPHVNEDRSVTLDLHPEVSELSAQATVQGGVIITLSEADTRVMVEDGSTAVIGGLINEVETKLEEGIPYVKDVPVLGAFFKFKSTTKKKRELVIFVTPTIVDNV